MNRHSELRSGWKILLFLTATAVIIAGLLAPFWIIAPMLNETGFGWLKPILTSVLSVCGAILGSYLTVRFLNRKPLVAIGLWIHPRMFSELLWGIFLGFLMMSSIFLVMYGSGMVAVGFRGLDTRDYFFIVVTSIMTFALGAAFEELMFRGYPFQTLIQGVTLVPAVIIMALLFAAAHLANPHGSFFAVVNIALAAVMLSITYLKTRNLWLPFGLHFGWNFSQTTLCSFPTSGIEFDNLRFFATTVTGPDWLTGGAFGPEGGALATIAMISCTWFILKSDRFVIPAGIITLDSVEDLLPGESYKEGMAK